MPKHVAIGLTMRHMTGSSSLIVALPFVLYPKTFGGGSTERFFRCLDSLLIHGMD